MTNLIRAAGYQDLIINFWGLEEMVGNVSNEIKQSPFWSLPIIMFDEDIPEVIRNQLQGQDEVITYFSIGSSMYAALELSGDGGFNTFCVLESDYNDIMNNLK